MSSVSPIDGLNMFSFGVDFNKKQDVGDPSLAALYSKYNITPSGNDIYDKQVLRVAIQRSQNSNNENEDESKGGYSPPWQELMWELGLEVNPNNPEQDYIDIMNEIEWRISNAQNDEQGQLNDVKSYAESLFTDYSDNSLGSISSNVNMMNTLGAISDLNKFYMINNF